MSSCYSIALPLISVLCVFREFEGREACRNFVFSKFGGVFGFDLSQERGWQKHDGSMFLVGMVVLIRSLPAKLLQNWILFLVKLVKTHFGHLEGFSP